MINLYCAVVGNEFEYILQKLNENQPLMALRCKTVFESNFTVTHRLTRSIDVGQMLIIQGGVPTRIGAAMFICVGL